MTIRQMCCVAVLVAVFIGHFRLQSHAWHVHLGEVRPNPILPDFLAENAWEVFSFPAFRVVPRHVSILHFTEVRIANSALWAIVAAWLTAIVTQPRRRRPRPGGAARARVSTAPAAAAAPSRAAASPDHFGDFRVLRVMGEGAMGVVYKARQLGMDRDVALKVLPKHLAADKALVERFQHEARLLAKLDHPNIVRGIAFGRQDDLHYFAMEFVDGEGVDRILARLGRLAVGDAVRIALDVARALEHAHAKGLIHRDIKPSNILISREGVVKVADLGLGKIRSGDVELTLAGEVFGTPAYISPEQANDASAADQRSDLYSLGVSLYEILTGKKPFPGKTIYEVLGQKEKGAFELPSSLVAGIPPVLDEIVVKLMQFKPERRYQSAAELAVVLEGTGLASAELGCAGAARPSVQGDATVRHASAEPAATPPRARPGLPRKN